MKKYRILAAAGTDQPGVVHLVSDFLYGHGCNMEDSRMAVLGGRFSLIALFSGEEGEVAAVERDLGAFAARAGLRTLLEEAVDPQAHRPAPGLAVRLELVAMDAPGIMVQLTGVLRDFRVNIESLDAHLSSAPSSETTVSSVKMKVRVPPDVVLAELKDALQELASRINLDVLFQPVQE